MPRRSAARRATHQSLGERVVVCEQRSPIGPQHRGESWGGACDLGEAAFHYSLGGGGEGFAICGIDAALVDDILFESVESSVYRRPQCPLWSVRCGEPLDKAAVHLLPAMQRRFGPEICTSLVAKPTNRARSCSQRPKKVLPLPYSPRTALNPPRPEATAVRSASRGDLEALHTDRDGGETLAGHCAPMEGGDSAAALWTDAPVRPSPAAPASQQVFGKRRS